MKKLSVGSYNKFFPIPFLISHLYVSLRSCYYANASGIAFRLSPPTPPLSYAPGIKLPLLNPPRAINVLAVELR